MSPIVIVGAGRSGLAAAKYFRDQGAHVTLNDAKCPGDMALLDRLQAMGINTQWGGHPLSLLDHCETLILSPGVPPSIPLVQTAYRKGICVMGELELAHKVLREKQDGAMILAITGTNGKSTTTDLLAHLLQSAHLPAIACGNLGIPLIEAQAGAQPGTRFALECSSYQLETVRHFHAEGATLLNLTPDHLVRHGNLTAYCQAKLNIFQKQRPQDVCLLPLGFTPLAPIPGEGKRMYFGWSAPEGPGGWCDGTGQLWLQEEDNQAFPLLHRKDLRIPGDHNVENALAASLLARHGGASVEAIQHGLASYPGLAHRIAFCGEKNGVKAYNDSKGTNVDATLTAIRALPGPLVLLLGGEDKGSSYAPLRQALEGKLRSLVFLGDAIPQLERDLKDLPHVSHWAFDEAVAHAFSLAQPGDQVLLSPACASFDQFKNFEERGTHFEALVKTWLHP